MIPPEELGSKYEQMTVSYPKKPCVVGSYILFLHNLKDQQLLIGSLGEIHFPKGVYIYIGSAFGPGGLQKRINRHLKSDKKIFWHIDNLTSNQFFKISDVLILISTEKMECYINSLLCKFSINKNAFHSIRKFGSSDCKCASHLHFLETDDITSSVGGLQSFFIENNLNLTHFM